MKLYEEIERIAYELWEKSGGLHGSDIEHWFEAERIVNERHAVKTQEKRKSKGDRESGKSGNKGMKTRKTKKSAEQ